MFKHLQVSVPRTIPMRTFLNNIQTNYYTLVVFPIFSVPVIKEYIFLFRPRKKRIIQWFRNNAKKKKKNYNAQRPQCFCFPE